MSDLAEKTYGGGTPTTSNEAYWNGDIPWIQSSDVVDGKLLGVEPRKWITQDGLNNSAAQLIPGNSIAIITRVGVGKLAFMPYSYATSQDFLSLSKLNAEPLFTVYACYKKLQSELNAVQGTSIKGITKDELLAKNIMVPRYAEQQQIGAFFKQLDHLITLHQRQPFLHSTPDISLIVQLTLSFYTFSWEQRKLGELVDRVVRKNTNNESTLPLTISAQYGLVDQITYFNNRVASRDVSNYYLVLNGEFAYNKSTSDGYPFGAVKRLDLYEKGVLSTLYIVFAPKKEQQIDSDYLTVFFDTDRWHKGVAERAAEGARNHGLLNISAEDFFDIDLSVPKDIVEQKQIGAFIRQLDNLITLHQRKCISFTVRAGRLISTVNKKRITSSWEQRKLGELVDRVVRKNTNNESTLPLTISAQYGLVDQITYFNNRVASRDVSNYYLVLNGEFAYNKSTSDGYPFGAVKRLDLYEKGVLSTLYIVFAPKKEQQIDSDYLTVFFDTDRWHKGVAERAAEGARNHGLLNISAEDFFDIDLSVPKDIVEQKQIGAFIRQLDNLITLHQRQPIVYAVIHSIRKANLVERQYFAPPMVRKFLCSLSANNLQYYSKGINAIVMQALGKTGVLWRRTAP